jgi:hypothetical protein
MVCTVWKHPHEMLNVGMLAFTTVELSNNVGTASGCCADPGETSSADAPSPCAPRVRSPKVRRQGKSDARATATKLLPNPEVEVNRIVCVPCATQATQVDAAVQPPRGRTRTSGVGLASPGQVDGTNVLGARVHVRFAIEAVAEVYTNRVVAAVIDEMLGKYGGPTPPLRDGRKIVPKGALPPLAVRPATAAAMCS